jgi:NADH dehydrogenase FAD-containing subunit
MGKHLVIVGGGHAHLTTLLRISDFVRRKHRVTLIGPSPYHYYSGMGPGMLSGIYRPQEIRFHIKKMAEDRGASFVRDRGVRIDAGQRILHLNSGDEIHYDVVSFNIGSDIPADILQSPVKNIYTVKPIENLLRARQAIIELIGSGKPDLLILGGGPAGLEIAGNISRLIKDHDGSARIGLLAGRRFFSRFPEKARRLAMASLASRNVEIVEGAYVARLDRDSAVLEDGREYPFDLVMVALGVKPSGLFRYSGLITGKDGGLLVNSHLQCLEHPEIFGGGDCISFRDRPLEKVGVHAVYQNPILQHNLKVALEGGTMKHFKPPHRYLLIFNLGDGKGISWKGNWIWNGRLSFMLKDYIDRRFMRRFQVSGEREEQKPES